MRHRGRLEGRAGGHNNLAWLYATAKDEKYRDKSKALKHARKAADLSREKNAQVLDTLAKAYFINGKVEESIEAEKKANKLDSENRAFKEIYGYTNRPLGVQLHP